MAVKFSNNATSTLAASINTTVTSISVQSVDAAKFPTLAAGDWFPVTVVDSAGNMEIMRCTARSGATLTVSRAQEGTTAKTFVSGSRVDLRLTTAALSEIYVAGTNAAAAAAAAAADAEAASAAAAAAVPAGSIIHVARSTAPSGYLKANGAAVSRTTYADLFAAIGTTYGVGNGTSTFNVPDLRGEFVRGWDDARGVDSGRAFGSAQGANIQSHTHSIDPPSTATSSDTHSHTFSATTSTAGAHSHPITYGDRGFQSGTINNAEQSGSAGTFNTSSAGDHSHTVSGTTGSDTHSHTVDIAAFTSGAAGSGTDTRPRNIALLACIKY